MDAYWLPHVHRSVQDVQPELGGERDGVGHQDQGLRIDGVRTRQVGAVGVEARPDALVVGGLHEHRTAQAVRLRDRDEDDVAPAQGLGQVRQPAGGGLQQGDAERGRQGVGEQQSRVQVRAAADQVGGRLRAGELDGADPAVRGGLQQRPAGAARPVPEHQGRPVHHQVIFSRTAV